MLDTSRPLHRLAVAIQAVIAEEAGPLAAGGGSTGRLTWGDQPPERSGA